MVITIGSQIRVSDPTPEVITYCKKELTIANPEYTKKARMGHWLGNTPKLLYLYQTDGNDVILPYGCLTYLLGISANQYIVNRLTDAECVDYQCEIPLYDYQAEAVEQMFKSYYGILQSAAGSGKTQMGLALACKWQRKTLWLTHTHDLLMQSKKRAEQYMSPDLLGTITEGKVDIGRGITFATVQTLSKLDLSLYREVWDTVIVDECHRIAHNAGSLGQFEKVLNHLAARHKYGLSATVHRADGMIAATFAMIGNVVYQVPDEAVADKIMKVSVQPVGTGVVMSRECLDTDGTMVYAKLITYLTENPERNQVIVENIVENQGHSCLILSDRLDHLRNMMSLLPSWMQGDAAMVDGKMTSKKAKAEREQAIEDMRTGHKKYLFATYALAKEGLDIPRLDRLFLTTPQKDYAVVAQSIGRIARTAEGKETPIAYDYVDNIQFLQRMYKKRCTTYRKIGCEFI